MRHTLDPDRVFRLGFVGKALAEKQYVGGNRCVGVFLKGVFREPNGCDQVCPRGERAPRAHIEGIERVVRADADGNPAWFELVEGFDKEIVVKGELWVGVLGIGNLDVGEWRISDDQVKGVVGQPRVFKGLRRESLRPDRAGRRAPR